MIVPGQRFGKLVALETDGRASDGHQVWRCQCDCGKILRRQSNNLQSRGLKHCGCSNNEIATVHGGRFTPEYSSWQAAKVRCFRTTDKDYPRYGGRGITMCDEWRDSFSAFRDAMGPRPSGTTLEREDVNGNYEPGNCVWATSTQQARNKRASVYVDWQGRRTHLAEVASALGITYGAAFMRNLRGKLL